MKSPGQGPGSPAQKLCETRGDIDARRKKRLKESVGVVLIDVHELRRIPGKTRREQRDQWKIVDRS